MLWWMWLTSFTTWRDRRRVLGYGVLYLTGLIALAIVMHKFG